MTNPGSDTVAFIKLSSLPDSNLSASTAAAFNAYYPSDWPEIELITAALDGAGVLVIGLLETFSRGTVALSSASIYDHPILDGAWLSDARDVELAVAAFKYARKLESTAAVSDFYKKNGGEYSPGASVATEDDEGVEAWIRANAVSLYHYSCTCKMGKEGDRMAVVDSQARVFGIQGLRVVDASVFPDLPPGQPQATVYMLAEKIAAEILAGLEE